MNKDITPVDLSNFIGSEVTNIQLIEKDYTDICVITFNNGKKIYFSGGSTSTENTSVYFEIE